ncbi:hypothetical protein ACLOJK_003450 [Asimina triloba]
MIEGDYKRQHIMNGLDLPHALPRLRVLASATHDHLTTYTLSNALSTSLLLRHKWPSRKRTKPSEQEEREWATIMGHVIIRGNGGQPYKAFQRWGLEPPLSFSRVPTANVLASSTRTRALYARALADVLLTVCKSEP